jgi:hypothetical protein
MGNGVRGTAVSVILIRVKLNYMLLHQSEKYLMACLKIIYNNFLLMENRRWRVIVVLLPAEVATPLLAVPTTLY